MAIDPTAELIRRAERDRTVAPKLRHIILEDFKTSQAAVGIDGHAIKNRANHPRIGLADLPMQISIPGPGAGAGEASRGGRPDHGLDGRGHQ